MSEFMGNICGTYDAKEKGFIPGASSLHMAMAAHGPEAAVFEKASKVDLKPAKIGEGSMAFMFETCYILRSTEQALAEGLREMDYAETSWAPLKKNF